MNFHPLVFVTLFLTVSNMAQAQERYVGVYFTDASYNLPKNDISVSMIQASYGSFFNKYVSAELRLGIAISDEQEYSTNRSSLWFISGTQIKVNHQLGAFLKFGRPVTKVFYPYAVIGGSETTYELDSSYDSETQSRGFAWGIGTDFRMKELTLNLELTQHLYNSDDKIYAIAFGGTYHF